jgi:hypothetical protein
MLSSDSLGIELFAELTRELTEKFSRMPLLINIAKNRTSDIDAIARKYQGYYFAEPPFSEVQEARFIQHFLLTKVVSEDYYLNKIKDCVRLTLSAMKCEPKTTGFKYLTEAVQEVIKQPYRRFNFSRDVYPKICTRYRIGMQSVEAQIKSTIRGALEKMSDYEKSLAFEHYPLKNGEPTVPEFIHAAAAITSQPCKKILRYLEDEPFLP